MRRAVVVFVLLAPLVMAARAVACACCADPGERLEFTAVLQPFEWQELDRVRFGATANVYVTAAGLDGVRGIKHPQPSYRLSLSRWVRYAPLGLSWELSLRGKGKLELMLPHRATQFLVDLHDGRMG